MASNLKIPAAPKFTPTPGVTPTLSEKLKIAKQKADEEAAKLAQQKAAGTTGIPPVKKQTEVKPVTPSPVDVLANKPDESVRPGTKTDFRSASTSDTDTSKTGEKKYSMVEGADPLYQRMLDKFNKSEEDAKRFGIENPEFKDEAEIAKYKRAKQDETSTKLAQTLHSYTKAMDANQEVDFWNKIIQGLGKITAGAVGQYQGTNVGGVYQNPEMTSLAEMQAQTKPRYETEMGQIAQAGEGDIKRAEEASRTLQELDSGKDTLALLRGMSGASKNVASTDTGTTSKVDQGVKQGLVPVPAPKGAGAAAKPPKEILYDTEKWGKNVGSLASTLNQMERTIKAAPNDSDFANTLTKYISSWGNKVGTGIAPNASDISRRFQEIAKERGLTDSKAIRGEMFNEIRSLISLSGGYTKSQFEKLAQVYGLPYSYIQQSNKGVPGSTIYKQEEVTQQAPAATPAPVTQKTQPKAATPAPVTQKSQPKAAAPAPVTQKTQPKAAAPASKTFTFYTLNKDIISGDPVTFPNQTEAQIKALKVKYPAGFAK